jgi:hypothetical protein
VTIKIVDLLEMVQIEDQQGKDHLTIAQAALNFPFQAALKFDGRQQISAGIPGQSRLKSLKIEFR